MNVQARRQFLTDYGVIRRAEGRGSDDPSYFLALPFEDVTGRHSAQWEIRARSYRYFERSILPEFEQSAQRPLDILDLGAGNGWMSYRLALRGHRPVALDIFADSRDGLRAARHFPRAFPLCEAEFDQLPLVPDRFDLAIFNSSFHYSADYHRTLREVRRCLRTTGAVVIMDTPVYALRQDGERMVTERREQFQRQYGFPSDALDNLEFLDKPRLDDLARGLDLEWRILRPWYGWRWHLRPLWAWLSGRRPPSRFWILVGRFCQR